MSALQGVHCPVQASNYFTAQQPLASAPALASALGFYFVASDRHSVSLAATLCRLTQPNPFHTHCPRFEELNGTRLETLNVGDGALLSGPLSCLMSPKNMEMKREEGREKREEGMQVFFLRVVDFLFYFYRRKN